MSSFFVAIAFQDDKKIYFVAETKHICTFANAYPRRKTITQAIRVTKTYQQYYGH